MSDIKTIYGDLITKGFDFSYNKRSKKLEITKEGVKQDLNTVASMSGTSANELLKFYLQMQENKSDTTETEMLMPPRRQCIRADIDVYGGNLKAILGNNSISYAIRDANTGCFMVKAKNSEIISSYLKIDEDYIDDLIKEVNRKLENKIPVVIDELPRQLFLYDNKHNAGGVMVTKNSAGKYVKIEADLDLTAFYNNKTVDQKVFTPNNPYCSEVLLRKTPTVFTNNEKEPCISKFNKDKFIAQCKSKFGDNIPDTPCCDSWLSKYTDSDKESIKDFIWTIFDTSAETSECLWLYDEGNLGKSTFYSFISKLMQRYIKSAFDREMCYSSKSLDAEIKQQFYTSKIYDKRLVTFADCKNTMIVKTELLHRMTGGDPIEVEDKYEKAFQFLMKARIMIFSNSYPSIDLNQKNELRRVILVTPENPFAEIGKVIKHYENEMLNEGEAFLYKCYLSYLHRADRNDGKTDLIQSIENKRKIFANLDIETSDSAQARAGNIRYSELFKITHNENDKLSYQDIEYVLTRTAQGFTEDTTGIKLKWHYDKRAIKQFMMQDNKLEFRLCKVNGDTARRFIGVKFAFEELHKILHPEDDSSMYSNNDNVF